MQAECNGAVLAIQRRRLESAYLYRAQIAGKLGLSNC